MEEYEKGHFLSLAAIPQIMPHFTKRIQTDFGNPEFIFDRLFTGGGVRYHVAVLNESRKTIFFNMEVQNGKWHIVYTPHIPEWITNLEEDLSQAINSHNPFN